jgi:hypothetical protein
LSRETNQNAPSCPCASIGGWNIREYQFPPGTVEAFTLHHPLDGTWERIHRCPTCAQLWLQTVTGGHATIEVFERIDAKEAARRIALEEQAAPQRKADFDALMAKMERDVEAMKPEESERLTLIQWATLACFGIGTIITLPAMMMEDGPEQMRWVFAAGGLFLLGMGVATWAALRKR